MPDNAQPDRLDRIEAALTRLTERQEALTMNLELTARDIEELKVLAQRDGEHIRQLAQNALVLHDSIKSLEAIAVSHQQRLDDLERP